MQVKILEVELQEGIVEEDAEMKKDREDIEQMKESIVKLDQTNFELENKLKLRDQFIQDLS